MVDNQTPESTDGGEQTPAWYRDAIARKDEQLAAMRGQLLKTQFTAAGVDTSKGLGKTMFETWPQDQIPESIDDVLSFAADRFEWTPPTVAGQPAGSPAQDPQVQGQVQQQAAAHDRMNGASSTGQPVNSDATAELNRKIEKAESEGNWGLAFQLRTKRAEVAG